MGNWELEKIKEFIRGELKKGYDLDTIKTSLYRAGFSGSEISKALATFSRKPKPGPGFFSKLFAPKKEKKTEPVKEQKKPEPKKPEPKPAEKTGPSLFEKFFYKEQKIEAKPAKQMPEPVKIEIAKPRGPSIFQRLFAKKPKTEKPARIELPKPHKKPLKIRIHLPKLEFPKINFPKLPKIPHIRGMAAVLFLIIFFAAIGAYMWIYPTACATENCFVRHASKCGNAVYSNIIGGTTMRYETNNCVLKKTITAMAPDEPQNLIDAFLGKNMLCKYRKGDFSPLYVNTLSGLLTTCEGDLRIAIQTHVI